jgi:hypothetical protein
MFTLFVEILMHVCDAAVRLSLAAAARQRRRRLERVVGRHLVCAR